ncbi:hypothetical protein BUL40_12320 [Croceivirga radicis]|uniref:Uncharacterized protein n=1 Tax=Croceivirga radicis TaxID=1929488 RepID=A0A1V6LPS0_9FLAO|nr:hypothetical protein [Croceivirga radicis]OQD42195.1 hypothetical protein BUL40_12320 [Croceivirga radicis]
MKKIILEVVFVSVFFALSLSGVLPPKHINFSSNSEVKTTKPQKTSPSLIVQLNDMDYLKKTNSSTFQVQNFNKIREICYNYKEKVIAQLNLLEKDGQLNLLKYIIEINTAELQRKDAINYPYKCYFNQFCIDFAKTYLAELANTNDQLSF